MKCQSLSCVPAGIFISGISKSREAHPTVPGVALDSPFDRRVAPESYFPYRSSSFSKNVGPPVSTDSGMASLTLCAGPYSSFP